MTHPGDDLDSTVRRALSADADGVAAGEELLGRIHDEIGGARSKRRTTKWLAAAAGMVAAVAVALGLVLADDGGVNVSTVGGADDEALDVFVVDATIVGELDRYLDVVAHPPGALVPGEVLQPLFTFTAAEEEVSIVASAFFADEFPADDGEGVLGVSGTCGQGWRRDGSRVADDPCSAVTPVSSVQPGFPTTFPFALYPRTESGRVRAGRYDVEIPLATDASAPTGTLRVQFEVVQRDPARLPAWPEETVPLRVSLEEAPALFFDDEAPPLTVRIEDPYRRVLVERSLEEILAEGNEPPSFEVAVPLGGWRVVTLLANGRDGGLVPCGMQAVLLEAGEPTTLTLVLDHAGGNGTCPSGPG